MIAPKLYIGGVEADLIEAEPIVIDYLATEIKDPATRKVSSSRTITLAGSQNNDSIFRQLFVLGKDNNFVTFDPKLRVVAFLQIGASNVLDGFFQLLEIRNTGNGHQYIGVLYSEGKSLFSEMGDSFIIGNPTSANDVNLEPTSALTVGIASDGNKTLANNFVASSRVAEKFWVDSGNTSDLTVYPYHRVPFNNQRVAIKCKHIIDRIFQKYGETYSSSFISTSGFNKYVYMDCHKGLPELNTSEYNNIYLAANRTTDTTFFSGSTYQVVAFNNEVSDVGSRYNTATGVYTCNSFRSFDLNAKLSLQSRLTATSGFTTSGQNVRSIIDIRGYVDGSPMPTTIRLEQVFNLNGTYTNGQTIDFTYTPATGDLIYSNIDYFVPTVNSTIDIRISVNIITGGLPLTNSVRVLTGSTLQITPNNRTLAFGDTYALSKVIAGKQKQIEFLTDMFKLFNMYVLYDGINYIIEPRDRFYQLGITYDWTEKVDRSSDFTIVPVGQLNWKELKLKFQNDSDYYSKDYIAQYGEVYGEQDILNGNEFIKDTKEVTLSSSAPISVSRIVSHPKTQHLYDLNNNNRQAVDCKPRYGIWGGFIEEGTVFWQWYFSDSQLINISGYTYVGEFNNPINATESLIFGLPSRVYYQAATVTFNSSGTLYNTYYANEINNQVDLNAKLLRCKVKLSPFEINNLKLYDKVIIDGVLFLISKINGYNTSTQEPVEVELIQYER